jgi:hypothetical protein
MRKLGFVALVIAAVVVVLSAWTFWGQDASTRRDKPITTVSYNNDTGTAYVWEWKGSDIIARTTYGPAGTGLSNYRLTVGNR